jgi:peptidoglycan hydrolase-like protein with peptidoglycan-binding domain
MTIGLDDLIGAATRAGRPRPDRRWPYGPVALTCRHRGRHPGEHKGSVAGLEEFLELVRRVETAPLTNRDHRTAATVVQRLRLMYYGQATGNAAFDAVLDTSPLWRHSPMTTPDFPQELLDRLFRTGSVRAGGPDRPAVDVSHIWVLADRKLNGLSLMGWGGSVEADITGTLSWAGDLASWWIAFNDRRTEARLAAVDAGHPSTHPVFTEPADEAALRDRFDVWFAGGAPRAGLDDLLGDLDAMALMAEFGRLPAATPTPVADLLSSYYAAGPPPAGRQEVRVHNRFHLFVQRAEPAVPHELADPADPGRGVRLKPEARREIVTQLTRTVRLLLLKGRWDFGRHHQRARRAYPGLDLSNVGNEATTQLEHELMTPWGRLAFDTIADRFITFLETGLAGADGWDLAPWYREPSPLERWGGGQLAHGAADPVPAGETPGPVRRLQLDLDALGFTPGTADGDFGPRTAVALREFQIEAGQPHMRVPRQDGSGDYETVAAEHRHFGPVNGVLDEETAKVLAIWTDLARVDEPQHTRPLNPLRIASYRTGPAGLGDVVHPDVRQYDDVRDGSLLVCATDGLRRHWYAALESGAPVPEEYGPTGELPLALGEWTSQGSGGPVLNHRAHYPAPWPSARVTAARCQDGPEPVVPSQYRAVAAVAQTESAGHFDVHNCWDSARFSIGLYHWTLASDAAGELPALLGYYKHLHPGDYHDTIGRFGIQPALPWPWPQPEKSAGEAKYTGRLALHGLHDEQGTVHPHESRVLDPTGSGGLRHDRYLLDWFRSWRSIFRFTMALRSSAPFRQTQYRFALLRLQDLLGRPFQSDTGPQAAGPFHDDGRVADFGTVFTSERAVTALLRWHVNRPAVVISHEGAQPVIRGAFEAACGTGRVLIDRLDPAGAEARQERLVTHLIEQAPEPWFRQSVETAVDRVDPEHGALSRAAGSFVRPSGLS